MEGADVRDEWIVVKHGNAETGFEVSIVRASNHQGRDSFGWTGENKLLIAASGIGPVSTPRGLIRRLVELAREMCKEINAQERSA